MTEQNDLIREDIGDGIVRLVLNRGPVNALSAPFLMTLADTLDDMARDASVRALVIASAFRVYSAGLDLKQAAGFDREAQNAIVDGLNAAFLRLFAFPKPVVAAVDGAAIAGGLFFVLASDFRVSGPGGKFGLAEVRVGVDFPLGPLEIARATLPPDMLRRLMLTGQPIDADTAARFGIVDERVSADQVAGRALSAARTMADSPPHAFAAVKRQIRGATTARIEAGMRDIAADPTRSWYSAETRPAMRRMLGAR